MVVPILSKITNNVGLMFASRDALNFLVLYDGKCTLDWNSPNAKEKQSEIKQELLSMQNNECCTEYWSLCRRIELASGMFPSLAGVYQPSFSTLAFQFRATFCRINDHLRFLPLKDLRDSGGRPMLENFVESLFSTKRSWTLD